MTIHAVQNGGRQISSRMAPIERNGIEQVLPHLVVPVQKPIVDTDQTVTLKSSPAIKSQRERTRFPHFQPHETKRKQHAEGPKAIWKLDGDRAGGKKTDRAPAKGTRSRNH